MMAAQEQEIPSLEVCLERFKKYSECLHYHKKWITPYKCNTKIETCQVCAKTFEIRRFFTQAEMIEEEIINFLNQGVKTKEEIYTKVVEELNVPRPTVRRVSRVLKEKMIKQAEILRGNTE